MASVSSGILFSGNSSVLERSLTPSSFSTLQNQVDGLVTDFTAQATDLQTLTALTAGGLAYRFGKFAGIVAGSRYFSNLPTLVRTASFGIGLAGESATFAGLLRSFRTLEGQSPTQSFEREWLSATITLGSLKLFGKLSQGQNLPLQHLFSDFGMVGAHQAAHFAGLEAKPEGDLFAQFLHAEAMNWQMKSGMGLVHGLAPKLTATERAMDLSLRSQENDLPYRVTKIFHPNSQSLSFALEGGPKVILTNGIEGEGEKPIPLAMASTGGNGVGALRPQDFPHVHELEVSHMRISFTLKAFSREPLRGGDPNLIQLGESLANLLVLGNGHTSLEGPLMRELRPDSHLRLHLLASTTKKMEIQIDVQRREIIGIRIQEGEIFLELFANRASWNSQTQTEGTVTVSEVSFFAPQERLKLSLRVGNATLNVGLRTISDLIQLSETDLLGIKNFGQKQLRELEQSLENLGFSIGMKLEGDLLTESIRRHLEGLPLMDGPDKLLWVKVQIVGDRLLQKISEISRENHKNQNVARWREVKEGMTQASQNLLQVILNKRILHRLTPSEVLHRLEKISRTLDLDRGRLEAPKSVSELEQILMTSLDDPDTWSLKTLTLFESAGLHLYGELVQRTEEDYRKKRVFGLSALREIKVVLASKGLSLGMRLDEKPVSLQDKILRESIRQRDQKKEKVSEVSEPAKTGRLYIQSNLGFEIPFIFESTSFNLGGLHLAGKEWGPVQKSGVQLFEKMARKFQEVEQRAVSAENDAVLSHLIQLNQEVLQAILTDRVRNQKTPEQILMRVEEMEGTFQKIQEGDQLKTEESVEKTDSTEEAIQAESNPSATIDGKNPGPRPTTIPLQFKVPQEFDSAAFNLRSLDLYGEQWEPVKKAGAKLLRRMTQIYREKVKSRNQDVKNKYEVLNLLLPFKDGLNKVILTDRLRNQAPPEKALIRILTLSEVLEDELGYWEQVRLMGSK